MAPGALAFPIKPASKTTVRTYGNACITCTGTSPIHINSTPSSLTPKASKNPNKRHANRVGIGFHLPNIIAANAI